MHWKHALTWPQPQPIYKKSVVSSMSQGCQQCQQSTHGMHDDNNKRVPGNPLKPPDRTQILPTHRQSVQPRVWIDWMAIIQTCRHRHQPGGHRCHDVQDMVERWGTHQDQVIEGKRLSALAHRQLLTMADENNHHNELVDNNVLMGPQESPPPSNKPTHWLNKPPTIKLKEERRLVTSSKNACTTNEADTLGALGHVEDIENLLMKLQIASQPVSKCSDLVDMKYLPRRARDNPHDPGGETAIPCGVHSIQYHPRNFNDERADETDTLCWDRPPGGLLDLSEALKVTEGDSDHWKLVEDAEYNGVHSRNDGNEHIIETSVLCRGIGLGGHRGSRRQWVTSRTIETTKTLSNAVDTMPYAEEWTAQQAQHATTQNKSKWTR